MTPSFIACNPRFRQLLSLAERLAPRPDPLVIIGEPGVGKETLARRIHAASGRSGPFEILEAGRDHALLALRGHEDGAFTGSAGPRPGLLERARAGTVYIDRLEELPPLAQALLERVIDDGALRRFGAEDARALDLRIIAAARRPLAELRADGRLRSGLAFRLGALALALPPLRERPEDLPWLVEDVLARGSGPRLLTAEALDLLLVQPWPGNLRQLSAVLRAACLFAEDEVLEASAVARALEERPARSRFQALLRRQRQELRGAIDGALARHGGRKGRAADSLGLSRHAFRRLRERLAQSDEAP